MSDSNAAKLSSIKSYLLLALIFNILAILVFLVASIVIFPIIWLIMSIVVLVTRVMPMRDAAERGDVAKLKELNSVGWGVVALIFAGIITGIMLLLTTGPINDLVASPSAMGGPMATIAAPAQPAGVFKFCPSCGTRMETSAAFCPKCGAEQK